MFLSKVCTNTVTTNKTDLKRFYIYIYNTTDVLAAYDTQLQKFLSKKVLIHSATCIGVGSDR